MKNDDTILEQELDVPMMTAHEYQRLRLILVLVSM